MERWFVLEEEECMAPKQHPRGKGQGQEYLFRTGSYLPFPGFAFCGHPKCQGGPIFHPASAEQCVRCGAFLHP